MEIVERIAQIIYDKKGSNILALDVRGLCSIAEKLLIAEANVEQHARSIAQEICREMKSVEETPLFVEGLDEGDWIVLDLYPVMVHIFLPEMRAKYQIERLFAEGKIIDLDFNTSSTDLPLS